MRVAVVLVLLAAAGADARRVSPESVIARTCGSGNTWDEIESCVAKDGTVTVMRSTNTARIVQVVNQLGADPMDLGLYLYVRDRAGWHIAGSYPGRGVVPHNANHLEVTGLAPLTIQNHTGYRFDITWWSYAPVTLDRVTETPGVRVERLTVLCSGGGWRCAVARTRCDEMVHGRVAVTFQGTLEITGSREVHVAGDDSHAGADCAPTRRVIIGWPES